MDGASTPSEKDKKRPDTAVKDSKSAGRSRTRSIWGKKKEKSTAEAVSPLPPAPGQ